MLTVYWPEGQVVQERQTDVRVGRMSSHPVARHTRRVEQPVLVTRVQAEERYWRFANGAIAETRWPTEDQARVGAAEEEARVGEAKKEAWVGEAEEEVWVAWRGR
jgi:hypothetical protein